jgi:alcohol dehydrogenase (cytochrome c)
LLRQDSLAVGSWGVGVPGEDLVVAVKALDVTTGSIRWQYARPPRPADAPTGGLLSTAGQVVFGGDEESFFALDAQKGTELWRFNTGGRIVAAPVTYEVSGRQFVAVAAGHDILAFALASFDAGQ